MKGHGSKLSRKMEQAIEALLTHRTVEDAARAIGVSHNTLLRWMKLPEFQAEYREARRAVYSRAMARAQQASLAAVTTMMKLMADANSPTAVRLRAAMCLLELAKWIELEDIEVRVAVLEQSLKKKKQG